MDAQDEFVDVVDALYASVLDESKWAEAIGAVTRWVGGNSAFHLASNPQTQTVIETEAIGADPELVRQFTTHFLDKDTRVGAALNKPVGEVLVDYRFMDLLQFKKTEIFNELLVPFDAPYLMALWLKKTPQAYVSLSVEAGLEHGPFEQEMADRFRKLAPHIVRVSQARELFARARVGQYFSEQVLHKLPFGLLMLDSRGSVIGTTPLADEVLREGATLAYHRATIRALNAEDDRRLQVALGAAGRLGLRDGGGQTLTVRRITHKLPLTLMVLPVTMPHILTLRPQPACLVLILDPERKVRAKAEHMQRALGLTHAESTLALVLLRGLSLQQAAVHLGRSYNTCKTQMKAIYAKTGCESQMDLVQKMMLVSFASSN